jgi:hypothetical protein
MLRPLPPFRVRPLKKVSIRKSPGSDLVLECAEEMLVSIKALRRPLKHLRPAPESRLRVLGRSVPSPA